MPNKPDAPYPAKMLSVQHRCQWRGNGDPEPLGCKDVFQMKDSDPEIFSVCEGDAYCWAEQDSSVMLKAVTKYGDPAELTKEEAVALAQALLRAAERIK